MAARATECSPRLGAAGTSRRPLPPGRRIDPFTQHQGAVMSMSALLYLPAVLAGALVLVAIAHTRAQPAPEMARPAQVVQFCQPDEPSADTHRLYCRHVEG